MENKTLFRIYISLRIILILLIILASVYYAMMSFRDIRDESTLFSLKNVIPLGVIVVLLIINIIFLQLFTRFSKVITIKDKYIKRNSKRGEFFIVDSENNSYKLKDYVYALDFNATDDYNMIEIGNKYTVFGYGFRIRFFSQFPAVYKFEKLEESS